MTRISQTGRLVRCSVVSGNRMTTHFVLFFLLEKGHFGSIRTVRSRMSSFRPGRFSRVGSMRSCASMKSADTQYSARWSLQEQVFSSGFTNIAFNKVQWGKELELNRTKKRENTLVLPSQERKNLRDLETLLLRTHSHSVHLIGYWSGKQSNLAKPIKLV